MPTFDPIELTSSAFQDGEEIPDRNSAYGDNVSPELSWNGVPDGTESLALVVRDPDAPGPSPFIHWVVYDIPGDAGGLPENLPADPILRPNADIAGTMQGSTDAKRTGYFGPRPPAGHGTHRYIFTLYALDEDGDALGLERGLDEAALMEAIEGHVLARGELVGVYEREE